jgi:MFS family permease
MGYQSIEVVFLVRDLGAGPATVGVVMALASAGGVFGALLASRIGARFGSARGLLARRNERRAHADTRPAEWSRLGARVCSSPVASVSVLVW